MSVNIQKTILETLRKAQSHEHEAYVNLYDVLPKIGGSFHELKDVSEQLQSEGLIDIVEVDGRKHVLLAKILEKGVFESDKMLSAEDRMWDQKVMFWIRRSIMGSVAALFLVLAVYSAYQPSFQSGFEADVTQEQLTETEQEAYNTLKQHIVVGGLEENDFNLELVLSRDTTKRFIARCTNEQACTWNIRMYWVDQFEGTWKVSYQEDLRE